MGRVSMGECLALDTEVRMMWFIPIRIALTIRKTRTSWSVTVRVELIG